MSRRITLKEADVKKRIGIIFLLVGIIIAAVFGGLLVRCIYCANNWTAVDAIVDRINVQRDSDGDTTRTVYVRYRTLEGYEHTTKLGASNSKMKVGDTVKIYYDPNDTDAILWEKTWIIYVLLFVAIGGVFSGIGGVITSKAGKKSKLQKRAKTEGKQVIATIIAYDVNYHVSMNRRHPYILELLYTDENGDGFTFHSNDVFMPYRQYPEQIIGKGLTVYYIPEDYECYYVDTKTIHDNAPPIPTARDSFSDYSDSSSSDDSDGTGTDFFA